MHEKTLKTERLYSGRIFDLDLVDVQLPNGNQQKREVVRHPGATALVAVDDQQQILLVRQYRIASEQIMSEIPAGTLKPGEPPDECAIRELQEETGYKPGKLESMGGFYVAPGYTTEFIHLFLATNLIASRLPGDEDEFIQLDRVPLAEALNMIENGNIVDAKTIIGLMRFARHSSSI
jgi:ADP-ribose pyrophosphatase